MQLYLLGYTNDDGDSLELLITADSETAAVLMWRAEWAHMIDATEFSGGMNRSMGDDDAVRIYAVNPSPDRAGVLAWHGTEDPSYAGAVDFIGSVRR